MVDIAIPLELVKASLEGGGTGDVFAQISGLKHVIRLLLPEFGGQDSSYLDTNIGSLSRINADAWHAAGYTGKGVKIGILDVGFDKYKSLLGNGLPAQVQTRSFIAGSEVDQTGETHGTSVAEIIHAIAPDAELTLAPFGSSTEMRQAIEWLVAQDVDIISNSTNFVHGPNDGTGSKARLIDWVVEQGVLWVNSAGNYRLEHYRAQFQDEDGDGWHDFDQDDTELMEIYPYGDASVQLFWNDWDNPSQDFDLYLYDSNQNEIASSTEAQSGSGSYPVEYLYYEFSGDGPYYVGFYAKNASRPVTFNFFLRHGEIEFKTADHSIGTPADSRSSLSVGAVDWQSDQIEDYSSTGPSEDGRMVPEISAPTNVKSVAEGGSFGGTSAACPHVSGAAGLVLQAFPGFTPRQVTDFLFSRAVDLGDSGADLDYGNGRLWLGDPPDPNAAIPTPLPIVAPSPEPPRPATQAVLPPVLPTSMPASTTTSIVTSTPKAKEEDETELSLGTMILLGCVVLPGLLGAGGIGLLGMIWYRGRHPSAAAVPEKVVIPWGTPAAQPPAGQYYPPAPPAYPPAPNMKDRCPRCGQTSNPGARVCLNCGHVFVYGPPQSAAGGAAESPTFCNQCGAALRPGAKFCPGCGRRVD